MLRQMLNTGRPITRDDLNITEKSLGVALLAEYRGFLLGHNGGEPVPAFFDIAGLAAVPWDSVRYFFSIDAEDAGRDLVRSYGMLRGGIPRPNLPIAEVSGGCMLCISTAGVDRGAISYWDYYGSGGDGGRADLHPVAESLGALLAMLRDEDAV